MLRPLSRLVALGVPLLIGLSLLGTVAYALLAAQRELDMGEVQRIFYVHVPSAAACLVLFVICAIASLVFLIVRRNPGLRSLAASFDRLAHSAAEIGVLFGVIVLITGPIWAKPAWGAWWTWEPRLTLMLLTVFLFIGYVILRSYARTDQRSQVIGAGVAVAAAPAVVLIHVAVQLWDGHNHPQVITGSGGGLATSEMKMALGFGFISIGLLLAPYLVWMRTRHHKLVAEVDASFIELSDLEESS